MPAYISEIHYDGNKNADFIEVAVPAGTDVSGYTLAFYDGTGDHYNTFSLGAYMTTQQSSDVYLLDVNEPFFSDTRDGHGMALIDDAGTVLQFVSYDTVVTTFTAVNGPANGLTTTYIGDASSGTTLESTDDGATYHVQTTPSPGSIPCFAAGTLIETPVGLRTIETLKPGDDVLTLDCGAQPIVWMRQDRQCLESVPRDQKPVLISSGALGLGRPATDLIVSPQHRILVGGQGQLQDLFPQEVLVPAKALTRLPRIRHMAGKLSMIWYHFACAKHAIVLANGTYAESLLIGPFMLHNLPSATKFAILGLFARSPTRSPAMNGPPARPIIPASPTRDQLGNGHRKHYTAKFDHKWRPTREFPGYRGHSAQ